MKTSRIAGDPQDFLASLLQVAAAVAVVAVGRTGQRRLLS